MSEIPEPDARTLYYRTLFVYAKAGRIRCLSPSQAAKAESSFLKADGWTHTATIDPAAWIEALVNAEWPTSTTSDMLDELTFTKRHD